MKKLFLFFAIIMVAAQAQAQVTTLTVDNRTSCDINYTIGGNYSGLACPGSVTSPTYIAAAGSVVVYSDPSQAIWFISPGDLLAPSDEIHFLTFYNTDDPACFKAYTVGECGLPTSLTGITIYDRTYCTIICNPSVNVTWAVTSPGNAVVTFF